MTKSEGEQLTVLDQVMDQLLIQTVCENNAMFAPNTATASSCSESEYTYEEIEVTDSGSEADGEETRDQDLHSGKVSFLSRNLQIVNQPHRSYQSPRLMIKYPTTY